MDMHGAWRGIPLSIRFRKLIHRFIEHAVEHLYGYEAPYRHYDEQYNAYSQCGHRDAGDIFDRPHRSAYIRLLGLDWFNGSRLDILREDHGVHNLCSSGKPP
jgi:hypothetical protein